MSNLRDDADSLLGRVEALRVSSRARDAVRREQVRSAMPPDMRAFVDEFREFFGEDTKLAWLKTDALEAGKPTEPGLPLSEMVIGPFARSVKAGRASGG